MKTTFGTHQEREAIPIGLTMKSCAGLGIFSVRFLKYLKAAGCPGFDHSRVDLRKILPWMEQQLTGDKDTEEDKRILSFEGVKDWIACKEKFDALESRREYLEGIGELISKEEALEIARACMRLVFIVKDRQEQEYPTALEKRDRLFIREKLATDGARLRQDCEEQLQRLEAEHAENQAAV